MPRIDDYINARNIAIAKLSQECFELILRRSGFDSPEKNMFRIPFLDRTYQVGFPQFEFKDQIAGAKGVVVRVMLNGYKLYDRIVRPAQVVVSTGPPDAS